MKCLQNLHTHSAFCDGKDTPEEMIRYALQKGFDSIGFSGHCFNKYSVSGLITREDLEGYHARIPRLKEEFGHRLKIWFGIEYEYCCGEPFADYDYKIGAVHYLPMGDTWRCFDVDALGVQKQIELYFDGDPMKFVKSYYETLAKLPEVGDFDILAHFDILTKNIERAALFDPQSKEYMDCALGAMEALRGKIPFFEVNSGAISKGLRTTPYPTAELIKAFREMGFGAVITSDCHDGRFLDCNFRESAELLRACGFKEKFVLTEEGFVPAEL